MVATTTRNSFARRETASRGRDVRRTGAIAFPTSELERRPCSACRRRLCSATNMRCISPTPRPVIASKLRHSSIPTGSVAVPPAESGFSPIRATQWPDAISESELSGGVGQNSEVNAAEPAAVGHVGRGRTRGVVTFGLCCRGYWSPTGIRSRSHRIYGSVRGRGNSRPYAKHARFHRGSRRDWWHGRW